MAKNKRYLMATFQPFSLNDVENDAYQRFHDKHHKKCKAACSLIFTNTCIGMNVKITCEICGKTKDITDYASW